ncbi:MAG: hypothetical protein M1826_003111 [Phylliscum demangeonii]|nr:MAG: hypothetical protein M1826_003111 [Phylliscum demangeonii]
MAFTPLPTKETGQAPPRIDSDAIDRVSKAWVPEYDGEKLWFNPAKVDSYILKLDSLWNPAKTLRMSIIAGGEHDILQMLIPPGLLNSKGGGMGITAWCVENIDEIPDWRVDYHDWNNIKGDRQPALPSGVGSFHLAQWEYAEYDDDNGDTRYEVEVKLFHDNKTQIGFQPRSTPGLPTLARLGGCLTPGRCKPERRGCAGDALFSLGHDGIQGIGKTHTCEDAYLSYLSSSLTHIPRPQVSNPASSTRPIPSAPMFMFHSPISKDRFYLDKFQDH